MEISRNPNGKRPLDHGTSDSPLLKRIRPELLDLLEQDGDFTTSNEPQADGEEERDLESVIRSFEEEIAREGEGELGFLLHASDDELGLPPPSEEANPTTTDTEAEVEVGGDVALVSDLIVEKPDVVDIGFDSDAGLLGWCDDGSFVPLDLSELTWQPMPAV